MKFLNRTLVVGATWGALNFVLLVIPLYLYGTSSTSTSTSNSLLSSPGLLFTGYTFGPLPVFPVGGFVLAVSFISAFAIADAKGTIKALCFSEIIGFAVSPLVLMGSPTPLTSLSPYGMISFFGFVAVVFFLLGIVGAVFGSLLGMRVEEEPGRLNFSLSRHRAVLLAAILVLVVGTSSVVVESLVSAQIQNAATVSSPKYVGVVANQTLNWGMGVENVSANFPLKGNQFEITWTSSINVSFHVLVNPKPYYREDVLNSCGGAIYSNSCRYGVCPATYCGYAVEFFQSISVAFLYGAFYVVAWFHNDGCSGSGCPSGWLHYEIRMWKV